VSVILISRSVVPIPTPVDPLLGLQLSVVMLLFAVKVYHSRVQSVPSLAFMYHV